eukprot:Unigene7004_Nuclearia_a/m.21448 Unigene7004_Nuclearia_a/g.21448  ORF Unigene7004_Nuclearia_a/g.21448 Unigene7004_Nuclearia_a/m.21448 type:complete len:382 (+) Unigene7004_Nuclearia_a:90-1235(+)
MACALRRSSRASSSSSSSSSTSRAARAVAALSSSPSSSSASSPPKRLLVFLGVGAARRLELLDGRGSGVTGSCGEGPYDVRRAAATGVAAVVGAVGVTAAGAVLLGRLGMLTAFCLVACTSAAISVALRRTSGGTGEQAARTAPALTGIASARCMSMWFGSTYRTLSSSSRAVMSRQAYSTLRTSICSALNGRLYLRCIISAPSTSNCSRSYVSSATWCGGSGMLGAQATAPRHFFAALDRCPQQVAVAVAAREQLVAQAIVDVQQVVRVLARVPKHLLRQRPDAPVGQLVLLVGRHVRKLAQQVRQAKRRVLEHARGLARVEQVDDVDAKVALQPLHVAVGAVEDLDDCRVGEGARETWDVRAQGESVDEEVLRARRDLH